MGTAFGADAAVAMFGAGSGNALTRMTKYTTGTFLVLCVLLTWMNAYANRSRGSAIERELSQTASSTPAATAPKPFSSLLAPSATNSMGSSTNTNAVLKTLTGISNAVKANLQATNPAPGKN